MKQDILTLTSKLANILIGEQLHLSSIESCTGGGVGYYCTSLAGASNWYECGYITYHDTDKIRLGVPSSILDKYGAVSEQTALAMAEAALDKSEQEESSYEIKQHCSLAITGIAGPTGGSIDKPVGMVCFGWAAPHLEFASDTQIFKGDRQSIREQSIAHSLKGMCEFLTKSL